MTSFLIGHLIGDFLLQTGWMASRKQSSWLACSAHVAVYAVALACAGVPLACVAAISAEHLFQDKFDGASAWMRLIRQDWGQMHSVGRLCIDQALHIVSGFVICRMFGL